MNHKMQLQGVLGVDKKNPGFTLYRENKVLQVYLGTSLMETVPDNKTNPAFKLLIGRLFNSGMKKKTLGEVFGLCYTTMKRWGDALKSNDMDTLARALAGKGASRKVTAEMKAFIQLRFDDIYQRTHYGYSQTIRNEIKIVFGETVSSETLRPLFSALKESSETASTSTPGEPEKLASSCELAPNEVCEKHAEPLVVADKTYDEPKKVNRKSTLTFSGVGQALFCNHAGVLLFSSLITRLTQTMDQKTTLVIQWLTSILLGMVNIEQTKLIDPESLKAMLGTALKSLKQQRLHLMKLSTDEVVAQLFACLCETFG